MSSAPHFHPTNVRPTEYQDPARRLMAPHAAKQTEKPE